MQFENIASLYQYFDQLAEQDADSDVLFASSYIRGFIGLSASQFGDEQQKLTHSLAQVISVSLDEAKAELSPPDRVIVIQYWESLLVNFIH